MSNAEKPRVGMHEMAGISEYANELDRQRSHKEHLSLFKKQHPLLSERVLDTQGNVTLEKLGDYYIAVYCKVSSKNNEKVYGPQCKVNSLPYIWVHSKTGRLRENFYIEWLLKSGGLV